MQKMWKPGAVQIFVQDRHSISGRMDVWKASSVAALQTETQKSTAVLAILIPKQRTNANLRQSLNFKVLTPEVQVAFHEIDLRTSLTYVGGMPPRMPKARDMRAIQNL